MKHTITHHQITPTGFKKSIKSEVDYSGLLEEYFEQLVWWNKRVNLVSRNVPRETIRKHIRHSLIINQFTFFSESNLVLDAGTGGGLPGIPLAITNPDKHFILNDIVTKKTLALRQMVKQLNLQNVTVKDASVESLNVQNPFLLISKHAFKINDLFAMTRHLPWTKMVFYKGLDFEKELDGIEDSLSISVYDFSDLPEDEFYQNKALVVVGRSSDNR